MIKRLYFIYKISYWYICIKTVSECNDGTFGHDCINNCSGHCLNKSPCNKQTGHCDRGCDPGYNTEDCNKGNPTEHCLIYNLRNIHFFISLKRLIWRNSKGYRILMDLKKHLLFRITMSVPNGMSAPVLVACFLNFKNVL